MTTGELSLILASINNLNPVALTNADLKKFPLYKQQDMMDCGPSCLKMVAGHFGRHYSIEKLRSICQITRTGVTFLDLSEAAEQIGMHSLGARVDTAELLQAELPAILHWRQNHYVVLYKASRGKFYIADPATGYISLSEQEFKANWMAASSVSDGVALFLKPTSRFHELDGDKVSKLDWAFITRYLLAYRGLLLQMALAVAFGTLIQLAAPFLTQSIVDIGINTHNLGFVNLILIAQVVLFLGTTSIEFIRSWILLHISTRINISILTDLLAKLMRLPMSFFDTKTTGDLMQRINDEKRIEAFLTSSTLSILFSAFNFAVFSVVIFLYNINIFLVFGLSTILYVGWIVIFLKKRKVLDYKQFSNNSKNQDNIIELMHGMQEIKMNNLEIRKRWSWEHIQARLFRFNVKGLALNQYQQAGAGFINQGKNIVVTYLSAKAVIDGNLTLGGMVAIQYIIGQLNGPVEQLLNFIKSYQDARISVERLNEIHALADEEQDDVPYTDSLPEHKSIHLRNVTFRYPGAGNEPALAAVDLVIPQGKTTAIVGMSGSGKTTLLKLLLRFYLPESGGIYIGGTNLNTIRHRAWRSVTSMVMQEGYIFTDTVANNIGFSDEGPDSAKLDKAVRIANLQDVIAGMPYGLNSIIGEGGSGISQGQKQRILIARAVYKNPDYIFFDEATNALDANNEKAIVENLASFLQGKTVVVVAHRLSTVANADQIIVMHKGRIIEQGTHQSLSQKKGEYYNLIKNQLEFGV
jgi:ATP-binding cassette subfamily B protein